MIAYTRLFDFSESHFDVLQIKRDSKMTLSDKISWIGGMMGLFTGFSVISAIEILYWLWFKVLLHEKDHAKVSRNISMLY